MSFRKMLLIGTAAMVFSIGAGCNSADDKPPKAEVPPGTKQLEKRTPGGAPGPGAKQAGPGSASQ